MNTSFLGIFVTSRRAGDGFAALSTLPLSLIRLVRAALRRRRWQQAPPFSHLNDHLRRDIGLPPLDHRGRWR